ncbi:MAG: hypothetical protein J6A10_00260, partial [Peptococcaceae bacterium]|nr:hypothetical protein [Peptococcaceae bacterium]
TVTMRLSVFSFFFETCFLFLSAGCTPRASSLAQAQFTLFEVASPYNNCISNAFYINRLDI